MKAFVIARARAKKPMSYLQRLQKANQKALWREEHSDEINAKRKAQRAEQKTEAANGDIAAQAKMFGLQFRKAVWRMLNNPFTQYRIGSLPGRDPELKGCLDFEMLEENKEWM